MTEDPIAAKLHATTDARVWAEEFCRLFAGRAITNSPWADGMVGESLMVGWFANAIETGRSAAHIDGSEGAAALGATPTQRFSRAPSDPTHSDGSECAT